MHSSDGAKFGYVGGDREAWLSSGEAGEAPPTDCASSPEGSAWDSAMVGVARGIIEGADGTITMFKYRLRVASIQTEILT